MISLIFDLHVVNRESDLHLLRGNDHHLRANDHLLLHERDHLHRENDHRGSDHCENDHCESDRDDDGDDGWDDGGGDDDSPQDKQTQETHDTVSGHSHCCKAYLLEGTTQGPVCDSVDYANNMA